MGESVVMKKIFRSCERSLSVVLCVIGTLLLVGCGGKPASVSGTVTLDGKPLERGVVGFACEWWDACCGNDPK